MVQGTKIRLTTFIVGIVCFFTSSSSQELCSLISITDPSTPVSILSLTMTDHLPSFLFPFLKYTISMDNVNPTMISTTTTTSTTVRTAIPTIIHSWQKCISIYKSIDSCNTCSACTDRLTDRHTETEQRSFYNFFPCCYAEWPPEWILHHQFATCK